MTKKNIYMTISGADGSGKTTTTKLLLPCFSRYGDVCVHWFRGSHLFASVLARFLHNFKSFRGSCNPYYSICVPEELKGFWVFLEFASLLPHLFARLLLKRVCKVVVYDRGLLDFVVWLIATLDAPWILNTLIGRFLIRLVSRGNIVYLYADVDTLARRADVAREFIVRELAIYNILARYFAKCSIDTGRSEPVRVVAEVIRCLEKRTR
ncbi:thymidylate kinase [Thermosphaera aggregans]|uniref:thymidylate kinase n=1 Tax=Thermosphaera aggregans TaxID=54254 RepID=UPI0011E546EC|nr:thymidylate kinase [Thermosphaera aggregans]